MLKISLEKEYGENFTIKSTSDTRNSDETQETNFKKIMPLKQRPIATQEAQTQYDIGMKKHDKKCKHLRLTLPKQSSAIVMGIAAGEFNKWNFSIARPNKDKLQSCIIDSSCYLKTVQRDMPGEWRQLHRQGIEVWNLLKPCLEMTLVYRKLK